MNRFVASVAEVLDVPEIGLDDAFRDVPGWCSLKAFGLLVLMESEWATPLTVGDLERMKTVRDLFSEIERHEEKR